MAIARVASASFKTANTQTNTSLSVTLQSTTVGDLNVIDVVGRVASATNNTFSTPAGWAKIGESFDSGSASTTAVSYARIFQSGDSSTVSITWANAGQAVAVCSAYSGCNQTTPIGNAQFEPKGLTTTAYNVALTTTAAGWVRSFFGNKSGHTFSAYSMTNLGVDAFNSSAASIGVQDSNGSVAASTYTLTATGSASTSIGSECAYLILPASGTTQSATADMTVSYSTAAGDAATKSVTGNLSGVSPATAAGDTAVKSGSAPLTVSPATAIGGYAVHGTTAPLTVSPTTAAQGGQTFAAQANMTITPTTAAGDVAIRGAAGDLTVTPSTGGGDQATKPVTGDLGITPSVSSGVVSIKGALADLTVTPVTVADGTRIAGGQQAQADVTFTVTTTASADISGVYYFTPPTYPTQVWLSHNTAYTVIVTGAHVDKIVSPGNGQVSGADYVYVGGHIYRISLAEAQVLHAAGYTVDGYTAPPGFGLGPFGTGPFGGTA